jgi:uncharacterized protein (TIGR02231 family)
LLLPECDFKGMFFKMKNFCTLALRIGDIAQLARALAWHARGRGFDSHCLHKKDKLKSLSFFLNLSMISVNLFELKQSAMRKLIKIQGCQCIYSSLSLFLFLNVLQVSSEELQKSVTSRAAEVKVYLSGAQVTRTASLTIEPGVTVFVLEGLSQHIQPATIQVNGRGNFMIMDVSHQINYLRVRQKSREVLILEDSLKILQEQLEFERGMLWVSKEEESLLLANKNLGGAQTGVRSADLKDAADLFRNRLREIKVRQLELGKKIKSLEEAILAIRNQLNTLQGIPNPPTSDIFVKVSASVKTTGTLEINYFTGGAGWQPLYDLRAGRIGEPVEVISKANVFQDTGEKWEKVKLSISSANPVQSGVKPILQPWYLGFYEPTPQRISSRRSLSPESAKSYEMMAVAPEDEMLESLSMADYTISFETLVSFEFQVAIPYTLPSDNKKYTVDLQKLSFPAEFEYQCVPKIDTDVFLVAKVSGWENQSLLPGEMQLFFEGTYVGKSFLNSGATSDTLQISLGRDKGISLQRTRLPEYTERRFLGQNRIESRGWEIVARNNKSMPVNLMIEDQLPVSTNKEIEITPGDSSGADFNKETGKIIWRMELKPSESKIFRTNYSVKYPRNKKIILD